MNITAYNTQIYPNNYSFKSNPNSPKLIFKNTDFFINIKGYGKDLNWAEKIIAVTDKAAKSMRQNMNFDKILARIALEVRKIKAHYSYDCINHSGVLRTNRKGYGTSGKWDDLLTPYFKPASPSCSPYILYKSRFDKLKDSPLETQYEGVSLTRMENYCEDSIMAHGDSNKINSALDIVGQIYRGIHEKYISHPQNVTKSCLQEINSKIAEIRWILAHATPWERGSDSISNSLMRAIYKSMGIKTYPAAKGVSFDLQAYCTELEDYKRNFANYFSKPPKVIDDIQSFWNRVFGIKKKP